MDELENYKEQIMAALFKSLNASLFLGKDIFNIENHFENKTITRAAAELKLEDLIEPKPNLRIPGDAAYYISKKGFAVMQEHQSYLSYKAYLQKEKNKQAENDKSEQDSIGYYHIKLMNRIDAGEFKIDLTKDELMARYVEPYLYGEEIAINGTTVDPMKLWRVRISKSESSIKPLVKKIDEEYQARPSVFKKAPEWKAIDQVSDVTDEIIKDPPGSKKRQSRTAISKKSKLSAERGHIFIGHGRSKLWPRLQIFLEKELNLQTHTFETESHTSENIIKILEEFLDMSSYAVIVLTAEDETATGKVRARQNVVHEVGLFQGRLGFKNVVLLKQDELEEFTNVAGLQYISFSKDNIEHTFYELQRTLKKAGLIT